VNQERTPILLRPERPREGRGAWLFTFAWLGIFLAAAFWPGLPDSIRWALVIAAVLTAWAVGAVLGTVGPIPGLMWMYKDEALLVGTEGISLKEGANLIWTLAWSEAAGLSASGRTERLEIRGRDGRRYLVPASLNFARIDGTTTVLSVIDLLASRIPVSTKEGESAAGPDAG
jgi:hypothetical protein